MMLKLALLCFTLYSLVSIFQPAKCLHLDMDLNGHQGHGFLDLWDGSAGRWNSDGFYICDLQFLDFIPKKTISLVKYTLMPGWFSQAGKSNTSQPTDLEIKI